MLGSEYMTPLPFPPPPLKKCCRCEFPDPIACPRYRNNAFFRLNYYDYYCRLFFFLIAGLLQYMQCKSKLVCADETAFISGHSAFNSELIK